jgi:DDE family transposase
MSMEGSRDLRPRTISIATWWKRQGARGYGRTPKLLVLADSGGSNSCTSWLWKIELQAQVCNPFGIAVTIARYPTGASKWNPIEHRLFYTKTGLTVTAYLDRNDYPTHLKPDPQLISSRRLTPGKVLPRWNYTIRPNL